MADSQTTTTLPVSQDPATQAQVLAVTLVREIERETLAAQFAAAFETAMGTYISTADGQGVEPVRASHLVAAAVFLARRPNA